MTYSEWNGFKRLDFTFEDRNAILVFPKNEGFGTGHWACKMRRRKYISFYYNVREKTTYNITYSRQ